MAFFIVTGKLGSGKSLITVAKMAEYLEQNRVVCTNLDLNPQFMVNPWAKKTRILRMPDKPSLVDFQNLPIPYEGDYSEEKTGLIVLDECGTWFNSRNYRDKERAPVIDELLHIRKRGYDVMLIVQNVNMIDSQVREGMGEQIVYCSRFDKISIPVLGPLLKLFGLPYKAPKIHQAAVRYGTGHNAPLIDKWIYYGSNLYNAYDTRQIFGLNDCALSSVLPPYYQYGRYIGKYKHAKRQSLNSIIRSFNSIQSAKFCFFLAGIITILMFQNFVFADEKEVKTDEIKAANLSVKSPGATTKKVEQNQPLEENKYSNVFISGSVYSSNGYYYSFQTLDGSVFHPEDLNLVVKGLSHCTARLIEPNQMHIIKCRGLSASREARPTEPETQESSN